MKVFHGSIVIVEKPDLNKLNFKTDFGKGFYTTTDIEQAKRWTKIKKERIADNKEEIHRYINVYEYDDNNNLNILKFTEANREWLEFVLQNRKSTKLLHDYDVVIGPVANDNLYRVLASYEDDVYDLDETIKRLKTYLLSNQISFHTEESLKFLKYIETIEVYDD